MTNAASHAFFAHHTRKSCFEKNGVKLGTIILAYRAGDALISQTMPSLNNGVLVKALHRRSRRFDTLVRQLF